MKDSLPLEGIKVLDFTKAMAGPFCTMLLADLGAEVIKVEPPQGDETRDWKPPSIGDISAYFFSINRNKKSLAIDLNKKGSLDVIRKLVEKVDILVENFRPGVMHKLGLDYESLSRINPKLIYCSISGFGQNGPYRDKPGYDLIALAMSGLLSITGEKNRPPVKFGVPIADITAGMMATIAILAALRYKDNNGKGQYIDISMLDTQILILTHQAFNYFATGKNPERMGSAHPNIAPYQALETKDGYIIVTVGNDKLWQIFTKVIEREDLANDLRFSTNPNRVKNREELVKELEKTFKTKTTTEWLKILDKAGIPSAPVKTLGEALEDEHVKFRKMVFEIHDKEYGRIKMLGFPIKNSEYELKLRNLPPKLGEHTIEILKTLGYSNEEIDSLIREKIIFVS